MIGDLRYKYCYPNVQVINASTGMLEAEISGYMSSIYDEWMVVNWDYIFEFNLLRVYI